jgi:hypothetical protein
VSPVNLSPLRRFAGGRTRGSRCVRLPFTPKAVLPSLSSRTTNWKWACFRSGVMSPSSAPRLPAPLQNGFCFLQHPLPAAPSASPTGTPAPSRKHDIGFTLFRVDDTSGVVPANTPAVLSVRVLQARRRSNRPRYSFGLSYSASLARLILTVPARPFTFVGHTTQPSPCAA